MRPNEVEERLRSLRPCIGQRMLMQDEQTRTCLGAPCMLNLTACLLVCCTGLPAQAFCNDTG